MPNWKKVVVSGSDAQLNSVYVPGPAINQLTASVAITALNTYNSTALNSGTVQRIDSASTTWNVQHNLNEFWPIVYIWEENPDYVYTPVVTDQIEIISQNQIRITFPSAKRGYVNVSRAGHIVSGSVPWTNLIGDANVTASLNIYGNVVASGGFTGSLIGTSSWANNSISSSYSDTASVALSASWTVSASVSVSSSYALTASYYSGSVLSASLAATSSYPLSVSGSTVFSRVSNLTGFNTTASIIIGNGSGISSTNASHSIFLGTSAGFSATNAHGSVFLGRNSGLQATNARNSNFLGVSSGYQASSAYFSNFLGNETGYQATNAYYANFLGYRAGYRATNASTALFVGQESGLGATNAISSVFLGPQSGYSASQAQASNFIGESSGYQAISATLSNFIGSQAGYQASNASLSTLIGYHTGKLVSGNGIGSNNIIIGTNITLENDRSDSINLGSILFATGAYSNQITNPYSGSVDGRVGINVVNPQYALDVSGSTNISGDLIVTGSIFGSIASASYAYTASSAISSSWSVSASRANTSITSSHALTASYVNTLTQNVILTGSISMSGSISSIDYLDFNTTASAPDWKSGRVYWNNTDGCLDVYNNEADITLQVGQENWTRIFNNLGSTITNGTVVRLNGAQGDVPTVERAQALAVSGSVNVLNQILGLATHDIEAGGFGYITTQGLVKGLNTNAFNDGDVLFVGTGSAGTLQNVAPRAPYEIIPVGVCVKASPGGSGIVYVAVQEPLDFSDLSSTLVEGTYSYGDIWVYRPSGSLGVWEHTKQLSGSYDITGSLRVSGSVSASLFGTSSQAVSSSISISSSFSITSSFAISSSYAYTASSAISSSWAISSSRALSSISSSYSYTASSAESSSFSVSSSRAITSLSSSYALTASFAPSYLPITGGTISGSITILGTASIAFLNVTYESSSVIYSSGSNQFGDATNDVQKLFGTVIITGSQQITGSLTANDITGSIFGTSSWAQNTISSSYSYTASSAISSSFANNTISASYSYTASSAISSSFSSNTISASYAYTASSAISSSFANTSISSSYSYTASSAVSSSYSDISLSSSYSYTASSAISSSRANSAISASYAYTASSAISSSYANTSLSSSYSYTASSAISSSFSNNTISASYAYTASSAISSSFANNTISSSYAYTASSAISSSYSVSASNAQTASYVLNSISSSFAATASNILGGGANYIPLWNTTTSLSSSVLYQNGGNIGIGTTNPGRPLEVSSLTTDTRIAITSTVTGTGSVKGLELVSAGGIGYLYNYYNAGLFLGTNGEGRVEISNAGNVGIGGSPLDRFTVIQDQNATTTVRVRNSNSESSAYSMLAVNAFGNSWGMRMGSVAANSNALDFVSDAVGTPISRMRLTTGSQLLVNTTSSFGNYAIQADGNIYSSGNIVATSFTGSLFGTSSWANNVTSASYAFTASSAISSSWAVSSSRAISSLSSSFALTSSFVNTLNQNVVIANALAIGTSSLGSTENTLVVGPSPLGGTGEGGQILLQATGGTYTSASMLDTYQNKFRILRGTNATSDAEYFNLSLHTGQLTFNKYTGSGVFSGTAVANLAVDSGGNVITTSPGGSSTSVTFNRVTASYTFVLSDAGKTIEVSGSTNTTYNLTIPASSTTDFADGTFIDVILYGTGSIQFLSGSGVTVRSANNWTKMGTRYGAATIVNISGNEWYLIGNVNA